MLEFPTTIDTVTLARSFALATLLKQREDENNDELINTMLDELINEIIASITPLEEQYDYSTLCHLWIRPVLYQYIVFNFNVH